MDRFFSLVWRANALVILAAGLAGVALVAVVFFQMLRSFIEPRRVEGVVNLANEEVESEAFHFGEFERIAGSEYLSAPLYTEQDYALGSVSKYSRASRNYLFYDTKSGKAHWLLPTNEGLVESRWPFPPCCRVKPRPPVVAVLWEIIDTDSNGDDKLTGNDLSSIYVSGPAGSAPKLLLSDVQQVIGTSELDSSAALMMFLRGNTLRAARIDLESQSVVSDVEVSTVPSAAP